MWPFGFTYPSLPAGSLNSQGGITGQQINIAGNDPNLKASNTMNYTVTLERGLGQQLFGCRRVLPVPTPTTSSPTSRATPPMRITVWT